MAEPDPLLERFKRLAGTLDPDDVPELDDKLATARAYLDPYIEGYEVPQPILDDCVLNVALDLWQSKDARNGIVAVTETGVEPYRISSDPLRSAWPKLRAAGIPAGMGIA